LPYESSVIGIVLQYVWIAQYDYALSGPGEGYVELSVYSFGRGTDEASKLLFGMYAAGKEDDVARTALIAFDGVNGDFVGVEPLCLEGLADLSDLRTPGRDNA
jgi:hypothetical protein